MNKRYLLLCLLGCLLSWAACKKKSNGEATPAGVQGALDTGVIKGYVHVYDQLGNPVTTGLGAVQLTLRGGRTVSADDSGHYVFDKVLSGNYYLTVSGPGLATTMVGNVNLLKDTMEQDVLISQAPTAKLTKLSLYRSSNLNYFTYSVKFDSTSTLASWILFIDNQPDVSNTKHKLVYTRRSGSLLASQILVPIASLSDAGIIWGDSVYVAAYGYVGVDSSKYEDVLTGRTIYSAVGGTPLFDTTSAP